MEKRGTIGGTHFSTATEQKYERTFVSALKWPALLTATDAEDTDCVVLHGAVICYQHLSVRFRYYDLPLLTT